MKLATRLAHARLRFRHRRLHMRVHRPSSYRLLISLFLVLGAGALAGSWYLVTKDDPATSYADQFDLKIESYSLNGQVTRKGVTDLEVKTAEIRQAGGITQVNYVTRTVTLDPLTLLETVSRSGQPAADADMGDIQVGVNLAIYTSQDPSNPGPIRADKIEIIQD